MILKNKSTEFRSSMKIKSLEKLYVYDVSTFKKRGSHWSAAGRVPGLENWCFYLLCYDFLIK